MKKMKKMEIRRVLVAISAATTIRISTNVASAASIWGKTVISLLGGHPGHLASLAGRARWKMCWRHVNIERKDGGQSRTGSRERKDGSQSRKGSRMHNRNHQRMRVMDTAVMCMSAAFVRVHHRHRLNQPWWWMGAHPNVRNIPRIYNSRRRIDKRASMWAGHVRAICVMVQQRNWLNQPR